MESAKQLYESAYNLHYKKRDYTQAYKLYKSILQDFPHEEECNYATSQIKNIENLAGFHKTENGEIYVDDYHVESDYERDKGVELGILFTSGYSFDGYRIEKYVKFITSEVVMGIGLFRGIAAGFANLVGLESSGLGSKLSAAKEIVYSDLRSKAHQLGANAIIGVDIDYTMFGGELLGVIMSGTGYCQGLCANSQASPVESGLS